MGYSCCVPGCKSNYKKDEPSVTVFTFPSIEELRQKLLQNIPRKFEKIPQFKRVVCIKHFEDKDGYNIHTNPDGTTVSDVVIIKLFYCTSCIIKNIKSMLKNCIICKLFFMATDVVVRSGFLLALLII